MTSLKRAVIKSTRCAVRRRDALRVAQLKTGKRSPAIEALFDKVLLAQDRQHNAEKRLHDSGSPISRKKLLALRKQLRQEGQRRLFGEVKN